MSADGDGSKRDGQAEVLRFLHQQGSECCRNYSQLTMRVRTLAQQVMLAYVVGLSLVLNIEGDNRPLIMFIAGLVIILFATVLWALNQHYSSAFVRIRDKSLVPIESALKLSAGVDGPWTAHAQGPPDWLRITSWHWTYVALILVGFLTMVLGMVDR